MFYAATPLLVSQGLFKSRDSGVALVKTGLMEVDYAMMAVLSAALYLKSPGKANRCSKLWRV